MRLILAAFCVASAGCMLALPAAAASPYPAANCLEVAKAGDIIEEQAEAVTDSPVDFELFNISHIEIREWLLRKCYPGCEDMDAIEGLGSLVELAESCGGGK